MSEKKVLWLDTSFLSDVCLSGQLGNAVVVLWPFVLRMGVGISC